jgi:pimeloyl-ACP methyl ester carboxylesterase
MLSPRYGELSMPVAIVAGDGDKIVFHDRHAEKLAEVVVGSDLRIVPGQGHMIHYGVPEQVVDAIDGVAARIAPAPAHG